MCLSIPYQIKSIDGRIGSVRSYDNQIKKISLDLLSNLKSGDWVLILNNFATEKISQANALKIINTFNKKYEKN